MICLKVSYPDVLNGLIWKLQNKIEKKQYCKNVDYKKSTELSLYIHNLLPQKRKLLLVNSEPFWALFLLFLRLILLLSEI